MCGLGPGPGLKYDIFCGPGGAWTYLLQAGPCPGLIIQFKQKRAELGTRHTGMRQTGTRQAATRHTETRQTGS